MSNRIARLIEAQHKNEVSSAVREHPAYTQGREAFQMSLCMGLEDGVDDFKPECPYKVKDGRRMAWWAGWYDQRIEHRLGPLLAKYGLGP